MQDGAFGLNRQHVGSTGHLTDWGIDVGNSNLNRPHAIGIVGCGGIVQKAHLPAYQQLDRVRVLAACDINPENLRRVREEFGIPSLYTDVADLCSDPDVETVVVATPPDVRENVVGQLARAGKHMLIEKPLAFTLQEGSRMVHLAREHRVKLGVNQNYRWRGDSLAVRDLLARRVIGDIVCYHQFMHYWRSPAETQVGWRERVAQLEMSVMSIHWVDRMRWLIGRKPRHVSCLMTTSSAMASKGETISTCLFDFGAGVIGSLISDWHSRVSPREGIIIDGTEGAIETSNAQVVRVWRSGGHVEEIPVQNDFNATFAASLSDLLVAVENDGEPSPSGADNLITLEIVDACYEAARTRQVIQLAESPPVQLPS